MRKSKLFKIVISLFVALVAVGVIYLAVNLTKADTVYYGNIITMDESQPTAKAVAVKGGKISFVGSVEDSKSQVGLFTQIKDFGEQYMYPGFLDGHAHMGLFASSMANGASLDLASQLKDNALIMKKFIEDNPGKEVYKGMGWWNFENDPDKPTKEVLDKYTSSEVPVIVVDAGGHSAILNSKAIEYFDVKNKIDVYGTDGIKVDANGEPTGLVVETARFDFIDMISVSKDDLKEFFISKQNYYLERGYTTIMDAGIIETEALPMVSAFKELADEGKLKLRLRSYIQISETDQNKEEKVEQAAKWSKEINYDKFKIIGIKIFLDGVPEAGTSWTSKPYVNSKNGSNYNGYIRWDDDTKDELVKLIRKANDAGLMVHFHSMGEGATSYALDCFEAANGSGSNDFRNGLGHVSMVNDKDFDRMANDDVIAFVAPHWSSYKSGTKEEEQRIYGNKATEMYKIKTFIDRGITTSFHTDGMCQGGVPEMLFSAATRLHPIMAYFEDGIRGLDERIDAMTALKCMTTTTAYSMREENNLGSITVGKSADFVVYDQDFSKDSVIQDDNVLAAHLVVSISAGEFVYPFKEF